jgi:hypothetical protein
MRTRPLRRALRPPHARMSRDGPHYRAFVVDDERTTRRESRDPRAVALEDEIWIERAVGLARARQLTAAALCVSDGRVLAEAAGPAHGLGAPDLVVLRRLVGARPRHLTLYATLSSVDPHRALAYREIPLARIVLRVRERPSEDTLSLLSQRGVDVRVQGP